MVTVSVCSHNTFHTTERIHGFSGQPTEMKTHKHQKVTDTLYYNNNKTQTVPILWVDSEIDTRHDSVCKVTIGNCNNIIYKP